jgi:hypothetical protein
MYPPGGGFKRREETAQIPDYEPVSGSKVTQDTSKLLIGGEIYNNNLLLY